MSIFTFYLIGCLIWFIGYFIYAIYFDGQNKKLATYHGIISSIISWVGIILIICLCLTYIICGIHDWIEDKLS